MEQLFIFNFIIITIIIIILLFFLIIKEIKESEYTCAFFVGFLSWWR